MAMNTWNEITKSQPKPFHRVLGYDSFYDLVHICTWDGIRLGDSGIPFLLPENMDDDVNITHWMPLPTKPV